MNIDHHFIHDTLVINLPDEKGRLTSSDIDDVIGMILQLRSSSTRAVAVNMSLKPSLNSSGLGELLKMKDKLLDVNIELILISPTERVQFLLSIAGVDQFLRIVNSEGDLS
jgi:anti-anti-sigma factor